MFLLSFIVGIVATPGLVQVEHQFREKNSSLIADGVINRSFFMPAHYTRSSGFRELIILQIINVLGGGCMMTFAPAMLSEIVDYSALKYRTKIRPRYYALFMFLGKFNVAVGGASGFSHCRLVWRGCNYDSTNRRGCCWPIDRYGLVAIVFYLIAWC